MYQKLSREKFDSALPSHWFEVVADHIALQAESPPFVTDLDLVSDLPPEARAIYFLRMFYCEVGGNGIECFILEQQGVFTPQIHDALQNIGAVELVERLEGSIPHAIESHAEFTVGPGSEWFRQFNRNAMYPTLQSVDTGIGNLVEDDLVRRCNEFIAANRQVLVS